MTSNQYTGYVCEVTLQQPTQGQYGLFGHLKIKLTSSPNCRDDEVPIVALYHLTQGAIVQDADADFLLTENQLMTLLLGYSAAAANRTRVRVNTKQFGGGLQILEITFLA